MNKLKDKQEQLLDNLNCSDLKRKINKLVKFCNEVKERLDQIKFLVECDYHKKQRITKHEIPAKTLYWGETSKEQMTWEAAKEWCEKNGGRLPTLIELQQAYADKVDGFVAGDYWSATQYTGTDAYYVDFSICAPYYDYKTNAYYVRCVYERMEFLEKDEVVEK